MTAGVEPTWHEIVEGRPPAKILLEDGSTRVLRSVDELDAVAAATAPLEALGAPDAGEASDPGRRGRAQPGRGDPVTTPSGGRRAAPARRGPRLDLPGWLLPRFTAGDDMGKAALRRGFAIHAYVGSNGGGKTLAMVHDTLPSVMEGRRVLSTVRLLDYREPRPCPGGSRCDDPEHHDVTETLIDLVDLPDFPPGNRLGVQATTRPTGRVHRAAHPLYVPFVKFAQLLEFRDGDVLMDEVTGVASSRQSGSMPAEVLNLLNQLRRRDVMLRWTAPSWSRADIVIREVTQAVTDCSGMHAVYRQADDGGTRMWRDRRLFHWWTYDTRAYDEWTSRRAEEADAFVKQRLWRPGTVTEATYDTLDGVSQLGSVTESGRCGTCGGRRSVAACSCADHGGDKPARSGRARGAVGHAVPVDLNGSGSLT